MRIYVCDQRHLPCLLYQVENLRKQALAAVGVRQFSDEGAFYDDMASTRLILPDVICSHCQVLHLY
jgi:hypothetical protein